MAISWKVATAVSPKSESATESPASKPAANSAMETAHTAVKTTAVT